MSKRTIEVIPSANRLIHSLRDIGYDFNSAVADLLDNSIAAGATEVDIDLRFDGRESWVRIADNGSGMEDTTITEAMRFGSNRSYDSAELGKFGLGLKSASLSQCSKLTVASRPDIFKRTIHARQWDLAHISATNRWEIIRVPMAELPEELSLPLKNQTGTVVFWEELDRIVGYKVPDSLHAKHALQKLAEDLDLHLGMVFHRFLAGEAAQARKLRIIINGTVVDPWDPFAREEIHTKQLPKKNMTIRSSKASGRVSCTPYILPPQSKFSSLRAFAHATGPRKWNDQQGFYIYRADRLIQAGGWCSIRTKDEHTKLARVALDFWPSLDDAFEINVTKARVSLPVELRELLKPLMEEVAKKAKLAYGGEKAAGRAEKTPATKPSQPAKTIDDVMESIGHGRSLPDDAATAGLRTPKSTVPVSPLRNSESVTSDYGSLTSQQVEVNGHYSAAKPGATVEQLDLASILDTAAEAVNAASALRRIQTFVTRQHPEAARKIGWD